MEPKKWMEAQYLLFLDEELQRFRRALGHLSSRVAQTVKHLPTMQEIREDLLEKAMAPHSSILAWKIPWMEEPSRLQSMGSQRVGHD